MPNVSRTPVAIVLYQHATETASLRRMRSSLVRGPHVKPLHLDRLDERLAAHLDGLVVAGNHAWSVCAAALERPSVGVIFAATVCAVADESAGAGINDRLSQLLALSAALPSSSAGLLSAFGWLEPQRLRGVVAQLLKSDRASWRSIGIAACALHRVDPGLISARRFEDPDPTVRARAWRTAGELGIRQLVSTAAAAASEEDPGCQFWAAWSAVLLGDKEYALAAIANAAAAPGPLRARAFQLALQAMSTQNAHAWLKVLGQDPSNRRWLIRGAGLVGDPTYVPWLIQQMTELKTTRLAGEAFSLITGLDLAYLDLEVKPPENFESGPNDDPDDPNVEMDEDDGLPWPDVSKIQGWWAANAGRFKAGTRYFMGEPLNRDHCLQVLKGGFQRQRIAAALYLSLLNPGTPLFNTSAPAPRQKRLLAQMS
ncbi:MAG TPA: TIGR02270 family protein [Steroidobacteraceae bacterium]|nr:TIGR02270 family protein [Steroidobacteraceae bacterium]